MIWNLLFSLLLLTACSSRAEKKRQYSFLSTHKKIIDVPFEAQEKFHCGPAALSMIANYSGKSVTAQDLASTLYTPDAKGTFQNDLLAGVRRLGLIPIPVTGMKNLLREIDSGKPVLIFQNLGLSWLPRWHYAVVVGFDLKKEEIILHSGETRNLHLSWITFENTWARTEEWGLVTAKPGEIPVTATEADIVKETAMLETSSMENAETSYRGILRQWPYSLGSLVGMGNISYQQGRILESLNYLKQAVLHHPESAGAWHNYALLLKEKKLIREARLAARNAVTKADPGARLAMKTSLRDLLN